jgi:hypothetical protein
MRAIICVSLAGFLAFSSPAGAAVATSRYLFAPDNYAHDLARDCANHVSVVDKFNVDEKAGFTDTQKVLAAACANYILGFVDAYISGHYGAAADICLPQGFQVYQGSLVYVNYMKAHPEKLSATASSTLQEALKASFPCR